MAHLRKQLPLNFGNFLATGVSKLQVLNKSLCTCKTRCPFKGGSLVSLHGRSLFSLKSGRPIFAEEVPCPRILDRVFESCSRFWRILWRRREKDKKVDHLVNYTMDAKQSWQKSSWQTDTAPRLDNANFVIHFDGGTRGETCAASAWILEAVVAEANSTTTYPVVMTGMFLPQAVSSFMAETIAMEMSIEYFLNILQ